MRTWAPKGQTPALHVPLTHDHLSVISGITLDGRLLLQMQAHAYTAEGVVTFLRALLDQVAGHLTVIWDGAPIHRSRVIKDFLREGAAKRVHLERLPGYAPDLNPDEGIWNYLKRVELANVCCRDLGGTDGAGTPRRAAGTRPARDHPRLLPTMRLPGLVWCHEISRGGDKPGDRR